MFRLAASEVRWLEWQISVKYSFRLFTVTDVKPLRTGDILPSQFWAGEAGNFVLTTRNDLQLQINK